MSVFNLTNKITTNQSQNKNIENQQQAIKEMPKFQEIDIDLIETEEQPREYFDEDKLRLLAINIKEIGLLNPLTVRYNPEKKKYILISGERRLRACKMIDKKTVPVHIISTSAYSGYREHLIKLMENETRQDLTIYEKIMGYKKIFEMYLKKKNIEPTLDNILQEILKADKGYGLFFSLFEEIGYAPITVYKILKCLELNIDHKKYLHKSNVSYTVLAMFFPVKDNKELIENLLDQYIKRQITIEDIKRILQNKNSQVNTNIKDKPKKQIKYIAQLRNIKKKLKVLAQEPVKEKEKTKFLLLEIQELLKNIEKKLET